MEAPFIYVQGLPELEGREAQQWLMRANTLALEFSKEVNGDDPSSHAQDATVIHVAATHLWIATGGKPCWTKLDVDGFIRRFSELPLWSVCEASAIMGMLAFYCFLVKHRHVPRYKVLDISRALERLAIPHMRELFASPAWPLAAHPGRPYIFD